LTVGIAAGTTGAAGAGIGCVFIGTDGIAAGDGSGAGVDAGFGIDWPLMIGAGAPLYGEADAVDLLAGIGWTGVAKVAW
jgi:hypothetical protein